MENTMKKLYIISGTMGVGKTTVSQILKKKLNNSVFLDGDWCWDMHPFQVTPETKSMVIENICYMLNSFIRCTAFEHIIFCWVMHEQSIIDSILSRLELTDCKVISVSLVCSEEALRKRLEKDIKAGVRQPDVLERSVERILLYNKVDSVKIDVSECSADEAAEMIQAIF